MAFQPSQPALWILFILRWGPVDTFVAQTRKKKSSFVMFIVQVASEHGWSKQQTANSKVVLMEWKVVWMATTRSNNKMEVVHKLI
jgi:hypothetical protein